MRIVTTSSLAFFLFACTDGSDGPSAPPPSDPPAPSATTAPAGQSTSTPSAAPAPAPAPSSSPGPLLAGALENCAAPVEVDVPAGGLAFTLTVDTRSLERAHFGAQARALVEESPASFALELAESGTKIADGWDVCVGQTNTTCFANLEMGPGIGVRTFTLTARSKTATSAKAKVAACVIDPLE